MSKLYLLSALLVAGIFTAGYSAQTASAQSVSPYAPSGVSAASQGLQITVTWGAPVSTSTSAASYIVYRNGGAIANVSGLTYTDTVVAGSYIYSVASVAGSGNILGQSAGTAPITVSPDVTPPTIPTGLTVTGFSSSTVTLAWSASTDDIGVFGYYVLRSGSRIATSDRISGTTYTDTGLNAGTDYTYQVVAYDGSGNTSGVSKVLRIETLPVYFTISKPYNVSTQAVSTSEIDISWGPSTDVAGTPIYYLYRDGSPYASTSATSYQDTGLKPATSHWYSVIGFDTAGNVSSQSDSSATSTLPLAASETSTVSSPSVISATTTVPPPSTPAPVSTSTSLSSGSGTFNTVLYFGLSGDPVKALQAFLIGNGYLSAGYGTGFFGSLTQKAVQQFQCAKNIVCTGDPVSTGWGMVGARTRAALNANL